jgi:hypothetical protein
VTPQIAAKTLGEALFVEALAAPRRKKYSWNLAPSQKKLAIVRAAGPAFERRRIAP